MNPARRTAAVTASAATNCASPVYKRELFADTTFKGTPKKTDCDSAISESWSGAPASGLPKDDFGSGGTFALAVSGLDGIRVYVDGGRKVDLWKNTTRTVTKTLDVTVPQGRHTPRIDYVNRTGAAKVEFTYTPLTSAGVDKTKPRPGLRSRTTPRPARRGSPGRPTSRPDGRRTRRVTREGPEVQANLRAPSHRCC
ncbi:hypothetical protein ABTY98_20460 [Streptomyces sp. NPDC096040]|uniref:hypothetical protein n=1 Tax=Streptomyces sp. NPDC096040 TaxID=3155541 RepID=UPI00331A6A67